MKILKTILGLPTRTSSFGIHSLLGIIPVQSIAQIRMLSFVRSTLGLPVSAPARQILIVRDGQSHPAAGSIIRKIPSILVSLCLSDIKSLSSDTPPKQA